MDKAATKRWAVLLALLAATMSAVSYSEDDGAITAVTPELRPRSQGLLPSSLGHTPPPEERGAVESDPFAPRGWQEPPPVQPPVLSVAAPAEAALPPVTPQPPQPPVLPFRFVGSFNDGSDQVVYLAYGEVALIVRSGDVLESTYRVTGISNTQIEFEHIPTGQKQVLAVPVRDN